MSVMQESTEPRRRRPTTSVKGLLMVIAILLGLMVMMWMINNVQEDNQRMDRWVECIAQGYSSSYCDAIY